MSFYKYLVPKIKRKISLIRTYDQEVSEFKGKDTDEYLESTAICFLAEADINELGIKENSNVKVSTEWGSVVLKAKQSEYAIKGIVFLPIGIWANQITPPEFENKDHIKYKNFTGFIESTDEKIKSYEEIKELFLKNGYKL